MKSIKPLYLLLIASSVISLCLTITLAALLGKDAPELDFFFLLYFLSTFAITFVVFYFLVKKFVEDRLKILYRSIQKGKMTTNKKARFSLAHDTITDAENLTHSWTADKNQEISRLKEQEAFRREFLGNLAHELKTPVFSIQGYILTLLDGGLEDEKVNRLFLERASKATDRMANILGDLDQITKLEVNQLKLDLKVFNILDLIHEIIDTSYIRAEEKNIKLGLAKDYSDLFVLADKGKISQVLVNLINNSIAYGQDGGHTTVRLFVLDNVVTVEVSDNGPGISDEHLPRLFERFYRVEKSRNRNEGGSGLGLAIVKHIIESHGQSINVRSTVGVGSTFAFTLKKAKQTNKNSISTRGLDV